MQMTLRWFGDADAVTLKHIRQIAGVTGIIAGKLDTPPEEIIDLARLQAISKRIRSAGLQLAGIESIPVDEEIKLGGADRDRYIDVWCNSLANVGRAGIPMVCYNFMVAFDWIRTDMGAPMADGSFTMEYRHELLSELDFTREYAAWTTRYTPQTLRAMLARCRDLDSEQLWDNLAYFLNAVAPVAEQWGISLALHPDDPPWSLFGVPRIITGRDALRRVIDLTPSPANGLCLCSGSLGATAENDIPAIIREFGSEGCIHFVHARNLVRSVPYSFTETAHPSRMGSLDMFAMMQALCETGYDGPLRPDHGRTIWGEGGTPGYGLYDRALGAAYLQGLWEALERGG